jgi:hypothetical protein
MTDQKPKIFLSYAHEDIGMAKRIYQDLKRYGLDIWFDNESLLPGQDWNFEIEQAIEQSKYFLALLSNKSIDKVGYIQKEVKTALEKLKYYPKNKSYILPIRLNDCKPLDKELKALHWIDVFPDSEYKNGINKILKAINPIKKFLRSKPGKFDEKEARNLIKRYDFFERKINPEGKGLYHRYNIQMINENFIVFDGATGLMWQQGGSDYEHYEGAEEYIKKLNREQFAGFNDWWLPTLEEAMSLMEPEKKNDLYIDPIFDRKQRWIWTADKVEGESRAASVVHFGDGRCGWNIVHFATYVRAVRSIQSSEE